MTKAKIGSGDVAIDLDGETLTLRPSLKAAMAISNQAGGVRAALQSVSQFDIGTVANVIILGAGLEGKGAKDVPGKVYTTGVGSLVAPVTKYLVIIANGGRPVDEEAGGETEENPQT